MAASTQGLSARLHAMEARLDSIANTIEQLHHRIDLMHTSLGSSTAIQNTLIDMMYKLQPLANFLSPLSNVLNPRSDSVRDSGLGDMGFSAAEEEEEKDDGTHSLSTDTPTTPSLRRRRGRSNLKADHFATPSSNVEEQVKDDGRNGMITVSMMQDMVLRDLK